MITTEVAFHAERQGVLSRLEVRTNGVNLMSALRQALFDLRVQPVRVCTWVDDGRQIAALDVVEFDGAPLHPMRRHQIQAELSALLTARVQPPPVAAPPVRRGWKGRAPRALVPIAKARVSW